MVDDKTLASGREHRRNFAPLGTLAVRTIDRKGPPYTNYSFPLPRPTPHRLFVLWSTLSLANANSIRRAPFIYFHPPRLHVPSYFSCPAPRLHLIHFSPILQMSAITICPQGSISSAIKRGSLHRTTFKPVILANIAIASFLSLSLNLSLIHLFTINYSYQLCLSIVIFKPIF